MLSSNFAVAVVTVVLRGLVDRIIGAMQAPIVKSPLIPSSTGTVLLSGVLYLLYNRLVKGKRIMTSCSSNSRNPKLLDGRIHKNGSQTSSGTWSVHRFRSCRSRSRCRNNLLQATKDSLEMLRRECSSTCSLSSKSACSIKCRYNKDSCAPTTKEGTPSVYSIKTNGDNILENLDEKTDDPNAERLNGFGDWEEHRSKMSKMRKRKRTTRKTRSGKTYSTYL